MLVFVGDVFVLLVRVHPLRGRVRDFIGSGRTGRKFSWSLGSTRLLNALVVQLAREFQLTWGCFRRFLATKIADPVREPSSRTGSTLRRHTTAIDDF